MPNIFVEKGSITYLTGNSSYNFEFMYNPEIVTRDHGYKHGTADVNGRSHPFYGGGCGNEEQFTFTLQLNADRGYYERRVSRNPNVLDPAWTSWKESEDAFNGGLSKDNLEDLGPVLDLIHTIVLPEDDRSAPLGDYGVPPRLFLDLGSIVQAEVGFDRVRTVYKKYSPKKTVILADVDITCHVVRQSNMTNAILMSYHSPTIEGDSDIVLLSTED